LQEELEVKLFQDLMSFANYSSTQIAGAPAVRFDRFLEKPLRGLGMLGGAAGLFSACGGFPRLWRRQSVCDW